MKNIHRTPGNIHPFLPTGLTTAGNGTAMKFQEQYQQIAARIFRTGSMPNSNQTINKIQSKTINPMKINNQVIKVMATLLMVVAGMLGAKAQVSGLPNTGDMSVCLNSTEDYGVEDNPTSTYVWKIDGQTVSPTSDWTITSSGHNTITVQWDKVGTYVLTVMETTATTCSSPIAPITIVVNPLPEVDNIYKTVCSDTEIGVPLPATDKNTVALIKYNITADIDLGLTGVATTGNDFTDINTIMTDKFTNTTTGDLKVVYHVIPYSASCAGAKFDIEVTISAGPSVDSTTPTACSDVPIDILLPTTDKNNAFTFIKYDIIAVVDPALLGNAIQGPDITDINAIKNDIFTNNTTGDLTVVYSVTPYTATCVGLPFTITVTVNPAVKTPTIYHK